MSETVATKKPWHWDRAAWSLLAMAVGPLTAMLLIAGFPPHNHAAWMWLALQPWCCALQAKRYRPELYLGVTVGSVGFHLLALDWIRSSYRDQGLAGPGGLTWLGTGVIAAPLWPLALWLGRRLVHRSGWPLTVALPISWLTLEIARKKWTGLLVETDSPWMQVGWTQLDLTWLAQLADLGGVWLVTLLICFANATATETARGVWRKLRSNDPLPWRAIMRPAALLAAVMFLAIGYGAWRSGQSTGTPGPLVCLSPYEVRDVLAQAPVAWNEIPGNNQVRQVVHKRRAANDAAERWKSVDLLLAAENVLHHAIIDDSAWQLCGNRPHEKLPLAWQQRISQKDWAQPQAAKEWLQQCAARLGCAVAVGCRRATVQDGVFGEYNCLAFVNERAEYLGCYDKVSLVPWTEFIPRLRFPPFGHPSHGFSRGKRYPLFTFHAASDGRDYTVAPTICFDSCFPEVHRRFMNAKQGPPQFFVAASAEADDPSGSLRESLLRMSRWRAIETRRAFVRNVFGGHSALIDGNGRVLQQPSALRLSQPAIVGPVPIDRRRSLYAALGDWVPWTCIALAIWGVGQPGNRSVAGDARGGRLGKAAVEFARGAR